MLHLARLTEGEYGIVLKQHNSSGVSATRLSVNALMARHTGS